MGFLRSGVCFPELSTVKAEHCAAIFTSWGNGPNVYSLECSATDFSLSTFNACKRVDGGACSVFIQPYPDFPACSYDGTVNLSLEYFGVLLAFLTVVYVATKIKRYFWNDKEGL